jgi:hypothetical protein
MSTEKTFDQSDEVTLIPVESSTDPRYPDCVVAQDVQGTLHSIRIGSLLKRIKEGGKAQDPSTAIDSGNELEVRLCASSYASEWRQGEFQHIENKSIVEIGSDTVVVHARQSVLMMNSHCAHKDGSMMFPLAIIHPLGTLHTGIYGLRIAKLLVSETVRREVGTNGGDETFDRFDRVVGLAHIAHSRRGLVQGLADSLEE